MASDPTSSSTSADCVARILRHPLGFAMRVIASFRANQGVLLSGAVAYYTLLSIVPLFALLLVVLSHLVDSQTLLDLVAEQLELLAPGQSGWVVEQFASFLEHRKVVGWIGLGVLLFFSSMAFTVLENAMSVIFHHRVEIKRRHFLISAVLPYIFILMLGVGLLLMSFISGVLHGLAGSQMELFGWVIQLKGVAALLLYLTGLIGLVFTLTAIYLVMPVGHLRLRPALLGGLTAALLWELARRVLVWYFNTLSLVNIIYGSLATAIVTLVSLEVAGMILLLGAQVIAEYERFTRGGECDDEIEAMRTQ